jgi:membrane-bound ClpP family serine protease
MTTLLILLAAGIFLITLELFLPGGLLGIIGGITLIGACVYAFYEYGMGGGLITLGGAMVLFALMLVIEFKLLAKSRFGQSFFLQAAVPQIDQSSSQERDALIGKTGETLGTLSPGGRIRVEGKIHEAVSQDGLLPKGVPVEIIARNDFRVVVRRKT